MRLKAEGSPLKDKILRPPFLEENLQLSCKPGLLVETDKESSGLERRLEAKTKESRDFDMSEGHDHHMKRQMCAGEVVEVSAGRKEESRTQLLVLQIKIK